MSKSVDIHDSKYRSYVSQIEKALRAFENTSEWADLIAYLAKLNKVLVVHSKYSIIPKNILIGKRLAQCLHPALPSGVHLKALETYDLIFKCIGTDKLAEDIFTYCSGLFPLLGYAAINVRPTLLQLYETHFLPLGTSIKPAMTGLIMSLLPGFENGSEFYDRTYQLLGCFCDCVEKPYFYGCIWECICVSGNIRHAALNYILMHFDKKLSMEDQIHLIGSSLDVLVEALCLSLEDASPLVQRCVLDLMISCFPIHNCQLPKSDIMKVLMYAITVLLRRDMSLNRRLNAWLMGNDINGMPGFSNRICLSHLATQKDQELNYLNNHSKEILVTAIKKLLENEFDASFSKITLLPLKIVISLLDRPELISDILCDLLLDILRCLYRECVTKLTKNVQKIIQDKLCFNDSLNDESFYHKIKNEEQIATVEIYKTANILFAKFDPYFIWTFIAKLFESACTSLSQSSTSVKEFCDIVNFLLDKISIETYVETQTEHFPTFLGHMVSILESKLDSLPDSDLVSALNLCLKMLSRMVACFEMHSEYCAHGSSTHGKDSNDEADLNFIRSKDQSSADPTKCKGEGLKRFGANETFHQHIKRCCINSALCQASNKHSHRISFFRDYLIFFYQLLYKKVFNNLALELPCLDYLFSYTNKDASWEMFHALVLSNVEVKINLNSTFGREILDCACQILEKCLVFGNYDVSFDSTELPSWFRSLIVVCLATPFNLQYVALNQVFNLIEIYQMSKRFTNFCKCCIKILNETCFYKITASSLWRFMSENSPQNCLKAVEVFNRIHQNAPYSWICEDVIAKEILSSNQENRIKSTMNFMSFWDCLKDLDSIKSRQFEKSILILLDNLDSNNYMVASLSKSWVMSCAKAEDLILILEPVIKVLLHPDTARVSLQQNVNKKQGHTSSLNDSFNSCLLNETRIVAVSNEGGNIVYHIDNQNRCKSLKRLSSEESPSLILTSLSNQGSDTRKCSALPNNYSEMPRFEASAVTLHVNPFGTSDEENTKVSNTSQNVARHARRLDFKTCAKEEICFNGSVLAKNSDVLDFETQIVTEILDDILLNVANNSHVKKKEALRDFVEEDINKDTNMYAQMDVKKNVHSLKSYILLYTRKYDFSRVLHAVRLLKSIITTDSKLILNFLLTSNMSIFADKIESGSVMDLFLRHKQSIMGQNFHNNLMFDVSDSINGSTYLELIVFGLLYFIRSFFNHDISQKLKTDEVQKNKEVQISCCNLLHIMFSELVKIVQGNTRLIQNISNLLLKSKVQKTLLYSLYSGLSMSADIESSITKPILSEMYTNALLLLVTSLIQLEDSIKSIKEELKNDCLPKELEQMNFDETLPLKMEVLFLSGQPIIYQPIFLEAIIYSLKSSSNEQMHYIWINFVQNLLPYFSKASTKILTCIILQLCSNLEHFENAFKREIDKLSPDYYIFIIKSLTTMYHYCLFESISDCKAFSNQFAEIGILQSFSGQLISGLSNAFNFQATNKGRKVCIQEETSQSNNVGFYSQMLDLLPSILKNLLSAWKFSEQLDSLSENKSPKMNFTWSNRAKQCILWFLNPLVNNSLPSLLASFTVIWNDRFFFRSYDLMVDAISNDQEAIVNILREVNHINLNSLAIAIKQMLKQPGYSSSLFHKCKFLSLEGGLLQMFYTFIKQLPDSTIVESITFVTSFVRECYQSNLDSSAIFVLICILHFILQKGAFIEEKREIKEIHDVTNKLLESCSNIAGLSLEQPYFFKRYLAVKEDLIPDLDPRIDAISDNQLSKVSVAGGQHCKTSRTSTFSQSIQALHVLADVTATLLDVVFQSDEKDKVIPLLNNILSSVFPYLRNHKLTNMSSFSASSKLLANLSSYQYTRRSWKRECFDLLLDSCFFQMDLKSLKCWIIIIDNLMAHDKSTFLDLLARFSLAQSSSLNLFGSREAESEMKIQLLKRLSFTVFCSETDQYQKHMPDIQEKLFDCLRSHNSPRLHAEVFSCFRVLVLRMSCYYLTSLWPTMITEMIQVFVIIEQSLMLESEDTSSRSFKTTDSLVNAGCDKNVDLFLAACKLLDLFLALPSESLPHFQLYKWAFVTDTCPSESARIKDSSFTPYALKIAKQMQAKFGSATPQAKVSKSLIIHATKISSLHELHEFFSTICKESLEIESENVTYINNYVSGSYHTVCSSNALSDENLICEALSPVKVIESIVMNDFLDKLT